MMENVYLNFWHFLKSPSGDIPDDAPLSSKLKSFLLLFILEVLLTIVLIMIYKTLAEAGILPPNVQKILFFKYNLPGWKYLLLLVLIAPVSEEIIFRLNLRINGKYLLLNIIVLIIGISSILTIIYRAKWFIILVIVSGMLVLIVFLMMRSRITPAILDFWHNRFKWIFYVTSAIFGLVHIYNYNLDKTGYILPVILIFPQFMMGLFLGFTRISLGFGWGCSFHALHNFTFIAPALIAGLLAGTGNYSFGIRECTSEKFLNYHRVTPDTVEFDHFRLDDIFSILLIEDKNNFVFDDPSLADRILIVEFNRAPSVNGEVLKTSSKIVADEILRKYNLKMKTEFITRAIHELRIVDSVKLNNFRKLLPDSVKTGIYSSVRANEINIHNSGLKFVARILSENLGEKVIYQMKNRSKYDLTIPKSGFDDLNRLLSDKYGLLLTGTKERIRVYKISSEEKQRSGKE